MTRLRLAALILPATVWLAATPLRAIYIGTETRRVPVARLVSNLEKQLAATPKDPEVHVKLARLYGMAYALNGENLPVADVAGREEVWFGHEPNLVPHRSTKDQDRRGEVARGYLAKALEHYRTALDLSPDHLLARLGYGWALEQSSNKADAIAAYRRVVEQAWPKEQQAKFAELGQRFFTVEAGEYLIPLLDAHRDVEEISELRRRISRLEKVPRPITPLVIPLVDSATARTIVDFDAQIVFDADGTGTLRRWTWITPEAGWLVYDADGSRQISSALQLFGNVTFWLFWANGYDALCALDDDQNGELMESELRYLAVWHDENRDGVSDSNEVRPLQDHAIRSLSCRYVAGDGVLTAAQSPAGVRFDNGRVRPTYDIILRPSRSVSSPVP